MQDITARIENLIAQAAECELISNLAVESDKRVAFSTLAIKYRAMADDLRAIIEARKATDR